MIEDHTSHGQIECVYCGFLSEDYTAVMKGTTPNPGDIYICWECGGVAQYALTPLGELAAKVPSPEAMQEIRTNVRFQNLLAAVRTNIKGRKR